MQTWSPRSYGQTASSTRIAMVPAIDPEDVAALTGCIEYVVSALS
jgi:phosphoserine aminotransferase